MTTRCFTMEDQRRFSALSGDRNPLHLDPLAARRSMLGGAAVHGVHLMLWALDELAAQRGVNCFADLRTSFERGLLVGDGARLDWREDNARLTGRVSSGAGTVARISLTASESAGEPWYGPIEIGEADCQEHEKADLADRAGEIQLVLPPDWQAMFPYLSVGFQPAQVAALLAMTRLVGMICPGLHSIFSGLRLAYDRDKPVGATLSYEVTRTDSRVRLVDMALTSGGLRGTVAAFLRPKPFVQPRLANLLGAVPRDAFAGQQAIVIGGSRGLGELAAKLLAAGGAQVTITWRLGEAEARAIVAEAAALDIVMHARGFDIADPPEDVAVPRSPYTNLYYFASPRILSGRAGRFQAGTFAALLDAYAVGLARSVGWFMPRAVSDACVWVPSTFFIDDPDPNFAEYTAAKACAEALCTRLGADLAPLRFIAERLPRLPTDQTQALADLTMVDSVATLRAALLRTVGSA
jgi:hypothetical protein